MVRLYGIKNCDSMKKAFKWLEERGSDPFKPTRKASPRNDHWHHMYNGDVISMPDKWEYPWYAAWDLAFHTLERSTPEVVQAKSQGVRRADPILAVYCQTRFTSSA